MKVATKIYSIIAVCILSVLFLFAGFCCLPVGFASATVGKDDYETFASQREKMLAYDKLNSEVTLDDNDFIVENNKIYLSKKTVGIYGLSKGNLKGDFYENKDESVVLENDQVKIKNTSQVNRLIVVSSENVENHGAILQADFKNFHFFQYENSQQTENAFEYYKNSGLSVSYDYVISTQEETETSSLYTYKTPWAARAIGFSQYTENMLKIHPEETLKEVVVAVLDTGIYAEHEQFAGRIYSGGRNFSGEGGIYNTADGGTGHGTHVAGIIANSTKFENIKILPLKVLKTDGKGNVGMIIDAIEYLVESLKDPKVKLLNLSVGITMEDPTVSVQNDYLMNAIRSAYSHNIIPVVAAGNEGTDTKYSCPGNVTEAVVVSALTENYNLAYFSNHGVHIDFAAPGMHIYSAALGSPNAYISKDGTSMATPFVSAVLCLIYTNPTYYNWAFDDIYDMLANNAIDIGDKGRDDDFGWGIINIQNIGLELKGEVEFSQQEVMREESFELTLSYNETLPENAHYTIYYSTDDSVSFIDNRCDEYSTPITIEKTTRVTATAYVYDQDGDILFTSNTTSKVYYFDNIDVLSNFEIENKETGIISKYNGILQVLDMRSFTNIKGIGSNAFTNANIKELYLPNTVNLIADHAFNQSETLEKIVCENNQLKIGSRAFYMCEKLSSVDFLLAREVGELAFAYCTSLTELYLPKATTIGRNAFSGSGLESILFGKGLATLQEQRIGSLKLNTVYGFAGTPVENLTSLHRIDFVDLTLRFTKEYEYNVVEKISDLRGTNKISVKFIGLGNLTENPDTSGIRRIEIRWDGRIVDVDKTLSNPEKFEQTLTLNSLPSNAIGLHTLRIKITDNYSQSAETTVNVDIVAESTQNVPVTKSGQNFADYDVLVNGEVYNENTHIYRGKTYTIQFVPKNGFYLENISFGNQVKTDEPFNWACNSASISAMADAVPFEQLKVHFYTGDSVDILLNDSETPLTADYVEVPRDSNLSFKIVQKEGYDFQGVVLNDLPLECVDGVYTIENITTEQIVEIKYLEKYYDLDIVWGKGFLISTNDISQIKHGDSRTFVITPEDGFAVDTVTVNGKQIAVSNNSFTLSNVTENLRVIVTFKRTVPSFLTSTIMPYFWVLFALIMIFVIAIIALRIYRKKHKK